MIKILTPSQEKILRALARYKFLTTSQMIRLGISNRRSNLSVMLKPLKNSKIALVGEMEFAFVSTVGRLESFYYLKPKGKRLLLQSGGVEEDIRIPKGRNVMFTQDYFHRKYTIDCHIACDLTAQQEGFEVVFFDRYFDKAGNNRTKGNLQAKTKIALPNDYIIADGAFMLRNGDVTRLFALELYNDTNVKRIVEQIKKHLEGIRLSSLCHNYGLEKGHRLVAVFTHEHTMKQVQKTVVGIELNQFVLFSSFDSIKDFFTRWY